MEATTDHAFLPNEDWVIQRLRECGAGSLEDVPLLAGLDWFTAFSIIDQLSRTSSVVFRRNGAEHRMSSEKGT